MEFKSWIGKRVFITLRNGRFYSGIVNEISEEKNGLQFISIIDKFGHDVMFTTGELTSIEEDNK